MSQPSEPRPGIGIGEKIRACLLLWCFATIVFGLIASSHLPNLSAALGVSTFLVSLVVLPWEFGAWIYKRGYERGHSVASEPNTHGGTEAPESTEQSPKKEGK